MNCGKFFNFKNDNGIYIYICSGYKNYGSKFCPRNVVHEKDLISLVKLHMSKHLNKSHKKQILYEDLERFIKENIVKIEVDKDNIEILYSDCTRSFWNKKDLIL